MANAALRRQFGSRRSLDHAHTWVTRDVEFHGQNVAARRAVVVTTAAANRDAALIPDPDSFGYRAGLQGQNFSLHWSQISCLLGVHWAKLQLRVALDVIFDVLSPVVHQ